MSRHYADLLSALERGVLEPEGFTHADHVGLAVAAVQRYPFFEALAVVANGLEDLARRAGKPEKFNATLTFASMSLIAEWLEEHDAVDPERFVARHAEALRLHQLRALYPPERLDSALARKVGLLPIPTGTRRA